MESLKRVPCGATDASELELLLFKQHVTHLYGVVTLNTLPKTKRQIQGHGVLCIRACYRVQDSAHASFSLQDPPTFLTNVIRVHTHTHTLHAETRLPPLAC